MRFQFSFDSIATPDQAFRAFTDFTERRPAVWRESLDPAQYEVLELGDTWAVVKEGTARPALWAIERYAWTAPTSVTWAAERSNFCRPGSGVEVSIAPAGTSGCRVDATWHRRPRGKGFLLVPLIRVIGPRSFARDWQKVLDRSARGEQPAG
jgi:hypothetical protein